MPSARLRAGARVALLLAAVAAGADPVPEEARGAAREGRPEPARRHPGRPGTDVREGGLLDLVPHLRRGREALAGRGLVLELVYWGEWLASVRGGLATDEAHDYKGLLGLFLTLDTRRAGLWEGGRLQLHVEQSHGDGLSGRFVGDAQLVSNLEAESFTQVSQLWLRQGFLGDRLFLKAGKQEANDLFATSRHAQPFLHSSAGLPPNVPLATYPDSDWGVSAGAEILPDRLGATLGVFQGRPDGGRSLSESFARLLGPMAIAELALEIRPGGLPGTLRAGAWWNALDAPRLDADEGGGGEVDGTRGLYAIHDQWLWREDAGARGPEEAAAPQGLALFAQYAYAPRDRSAIEHYAGAGLLWRGALPARDADALGLAAYHARFSPELGTERRAETAVEALYALRLRPWLTWKLDAQLVVDPGGADLREAVVLGTRVRVHF